VGRVRGPAYPARPPHDQPRWPVPDHQPTTRHRTPAATNRFTQDPVPILVTGQQARGLSTGRPAKLNATTRAGAAQRIGDGAIAEQVAADLGVSRSTLYRELRKHREGAFAEQIVREG
jgi:transcriptional regulator of acetoin/glycerol metabolism